MILSLSEFATILAALRYFQDEFQTATPGEIAKLFPQFVTAAPLTSAEIGSLCERLNIAEPDEDQEPCDCEAPGLIHASIPVILAHLQEERVAPGAFVERCDMCLWFASDNEAKSRLRELGIA